MAGQWNGIRLWHYIGRFRQFDGRTRAKQAVITKKISNLVRPASQTVKLGLTPDDGKIRNLLEIAQAKQFADAEKRAQPAVTEGAGLLKVGRLEAAEAIFRSVLEVHPSSAVARYSLATIHYARREYAQATEELLKLLELYPGNVDARYSLAIVHSTLEAYDQAEVQLQEVLRLAPHHERARTALQNLNDARR